MIGENCGMNEYSTQEITICTIPKWKKVFQDIRQNPSLDNAVEILFKVNSRGSTLKTEILCGFIHFLSTASVLAVNSTMLKVGGYDKSKVACSTAIGCAITCLLIGLFGNLPFVATPTLACSIYLSLFLKNNHLPPAVGNTIVFFVGVLITICTERRIADSLRNIMPISLQLGICIGLSLLVALIALAHLEIVVLGQYTILSLGSILTTKVIIAMASFIVIGTLKHYQINGSYVIGLLFGSLSYWIFSNNWPTRVFAPITFSFETDFSILTTSLEPCLCVFDIFIISLVLLAGLSPNLALLAGIEKGNGITVPPRNRWLFFSCGIGTIIGSFIGTGPILPSTESAVAILSGARTGLSAVVCGLLFAISVPCFPLWSNIPLSGTGPVLFMVAVMLFENTKKVNWENTAEGLTVFITAIFSGFTYSIFNGVLFGISIFVIMKVITGDMNEIFSRAVTHIKNKLIPAQEIKYEIIHQSYYQATLNLNEYVDTIEDHLECSRKSNSSQDISTLDYDISNECV